MAKPKQAFGDSTMTTKGICSLKPHRSARKTLSSKPLPKLSKSQPTSTKTKPLLPLDRYTLFETISYLYWKIYKFYKKKGHTKWESGKIAKKVCMKRFGYENYQKWRHRFENQNYSQIYHELKAKGYDRR